MLMKVLSANAATSSSAEKISGQTNKQTNKQTDKQTNKLDQSQDIVTGNDYMSSLTSFQNAFTTNNWLHLPVPWFRQLVSKDIFLHHIKYLTKFSVSYHYP